MSRMLTAAGMTVPHEQMGADGTISSFFTVDDYYYCRGAHRDGRRSAWTFDVMAHQVRHPLGVIASLADYRYAPWWHWQEKHTGVSFDLAPVERATEFWLRWTSLADDVAPMRYQIEQPKGAWAYFAEKFGLGEMPDTGPVGQSRNAMALSWNDLPAEQRGDVLERAAEYGYA